MAAPQFEVAWPAVALANSRGAEKVFRHGQKITPSYLTQSGTTALLDIGAIVPAGGQDEGPTEPEEPSIEGDDGPDGDQGDADAGDDE